jgi:hypothetical protein
MFTCRPRQKQPQKLKKEMGARKHPAPNSFTVHRSAFGVRRSAFGGRRAAGGAASLFWLEI